MVSNVLDLNHQHPISCRIVQGDSEAMKSKANYRARWKIPSNGPLPKVGLKPYNPFFAAGSRMLPAAISELD